MHIYHCHSADTMASKGVIKAKKKPRKTTKKAYKSTACKKSGLSSCANAERGISTKKSKAVRKKSIPKKKLQAPRKKSLSAKNVKYLEGLGLKVKQRKH